jgi:GNAT superfamily N-acetyltransferase
MRERLARLVEQLRESTTIDPLRGGVTVEPLQSSDIERAAVVLAEAFRPERFTTAALGGNSDSVQSVFASFLAGRLRAYMRHSQPLFVARDGDDIVGVVILVRPSFSLPRRDVARAFSEAWRGLPTVMRTVDPRKMYQVLSAHEPPDGVKQTRYELEYIGVHPDRQGEGIGRLLLDVVHEFTDRDPGAEGVYLATAGEWTRDLYASVEYETVETIAVDDITVDGSQLYAYHMCRPATPTTFSEATV